MRRRIAALGAAVGAALGLLCPAPVTAAPAAPAARQLPVGTASGATSLLAAPGGVMWYYDGAQVERSSDGGAHWRPVFPSWAITPTSLQVTGAFFLNPDDAWATTDHEWPAPPGVTTTWWTTDGGARWHKGISVPGELTDYGSAFDQFVFGDATHGYGFTVDGSTSAAGTERTDILWTSSDGGRHWAHTNAVGLPWQASTVPFKPTQGCTDTDPFSLSATGAVVLLGSYGCPTPSPGLWRSGNGGQSWAAVHLPAPPGGWAAAESWAYPRPGFQRPGAEVLSARFFAGGQAVLAITTRPGELLVYRSGDDGASWHLASELSTGQLSRPSGFAASSPSAWELPAPAGLYVTLDGGRHWHLQASPLSLPDLVATSFASPALGAGVTSTGAVGWRTADGGRSWHTVLFGVPGTANPTVGFGTVDFVSPTLGWVGGLDGIAATTDGGRSWAPQLTTSAPVEEISFADGQHGWALTADQLFSTVNGGRQWDAVAETPFGAFSTVQLVSAGFGVALVCGPAGARALVSHDEGRHWQVLPLPQANQLACGQDAQFGVDVQELCFGTPQSGWAVLDALGYKGVMEHTADGGEHWSPVAKFDPLPTQLACQGPGRAWVGLNWLENMAEAGDLATTADGGTTWLIGKYGPSVFNTPRMTATDGTAVGPLGKGNALKEPIWAPVSAILAPSPQVAVDFWSNYGPGCEGFGLVVTTDGGNTWSDRPSPVSRPAAQGGCYGAGLPFLASAGIPNSPPSLSFPDPEHGFVLAPMAGTKAPGKGTGGSVTMALIGTDDGGQTWRLLSRFPGPHPAP